MLILLNGLSKIKENMLQVKYVRFQHKFMFLTHSPQENNWFTTNDSKNIQDRYNLYLPTNRDEAKKGDKLHTIKINNSINLILILPTVLLFFGEMKSMSLGHHSGLRVTPNVPPPTIL